MDDTIEDLRHKVEEIRERSVCLIAKPGSNVPNCHERDYCRCDIDAVDKYYEAVVARKNKEIKKLSEYMTIRKALTVKEELEPIIRYYEDTFKDHEWDVCCSGHECGCYGKPIDPEYYIYESLMKLKEIL